MHETTDAGSAHEIGPNAARVHQPDHITIEERLRTDTITDTVAVDHSVESAPSDATTHGATTSRYAERAIVGRPGPEFEPAPTNPAHRSVPYRPDTVIDGWSIDRLTVRLASLRGELHRYHGVPRQDDVAVQVLRDPWRLVIAVADGVSSAHQSHIGATVAVRYAVQYIESHLGDDITAFDWHQLVKSTAWAIVEQAAGLYGTPPDAGETEQLMATTLTCCVVEPLEAWTLVHAVGVGDSGLWCLRDGMFYSLIGGKAADGADITSSTVCGLPRVPTEVSPTVHELPSDAVLLVGTDGFGDPLGSGAGDVGHLFASRLTAPPSMLDFAHTLDFSRETFDDDRTLVAVWNDAMA